MNTWEFLGLFWREFRRWVILKNPMQLQSLGLFRLQISIEGVVLSMNRRHCSDLLTILEKESWSGVAWFPWKWMWRGCFWLRNWQRRCKGARHGRRHWWKCRRRPKQAGRQPWASSFDGSGRSPPFIFCVCIWWWTPPVLNPNPRIKLLWVQEPASVDPRSMKPH